MFSFHLLFEQIINGIFTGAMYSLMAVGLALIWGILDLFNFAHGALYMLGAYLVYYLTIFWGVNLLVSSLIAIVVLFFLGMVLDRFLVRPLRTLQGKEVWTWNSSTIVITLGFGLAAEAFALLVFGSDYKSLPPLLSGVIKVGFATVSRQMVLSFLWRLC